MLKKWLNPVLYFFEKYYFIPIITAFLTAGIIFYLSSIPASGYPSGLGINTKIYHFGIYGILGFFVSMAIIRGKIENKYLIIIALLLSIAYAITDEIHQFFVPGRHTAIKDVFIDSTGVLASVVIYYAFREKI